MSERKTERRLRPTSTWKWREEGSGRATGIRKTVGKLLSRTKETCEGLSKERGEDSSVQGNWDSVATRPVGSARQARMEKAFQFDGLGYDGGKKIRWMKIIINEIF